jgi:hypothetical protein
MIIEDLTGSCGGKSSRTIFTKIAVLVSLNSDRYEADSGHSYFLLLLLVLPDC